MRADPIPHDAVVAIILTAVTADSNPPLYPLGNLCIATLPFGMLLESDAGALRRRRVA